MVTNAAAHVSYAFSEVAAIYPITPSSPMADFVDQWSANGLKNIFGTKVKVVEDAVLRSRKRHAVHGSGRRCADHHLHRLPGLLLMIPNMYKIAAGAAARRVGSTSPPVLCPPRR